MRLSTIVAFVIAICTGAALTSCPLGPEREKQVQKQARVPGLEEMVLAKDKALKAAILISWKSDPELAQEQLAVEDVHAGKVRITGIVSRPELKDRAEAIARNQEGVEDVVSTITVDEKLKEKRISLDDM
jgi:osmotically-inducible protein OsmY